MTSSHLAIDIGASSGRVILGVLGGSPPTLRIEEAHRFKHEPIDTPSGLVWDITGIASQVFSGIRTGAEAARDNGVELSSIGVDTWAVDWAIITRDGKLSGLPKCYRDPSNLIACDRVLDLIKGGVEALYLRSGIQPLPFNTLFQLHGQLHDAPELIPPSGKLLLLPDLLHFWLTGRCSNERTNASTGALLNATANDWDRELLTRLGIPTGLFGELCEPGTPLGPLRPQLADSLGVAQGVQVVAPATHDTASAVAAVPALGPRGSWAYLSSGTWSLLGTETSEPIVTLEALRGRFTNEVGVGTSGQPSIRFLRNIGGLWLVQELQRDLSRQGDEVGFADLVAQAEPVDPFRTVIDPNAEDLAQPGGSIRKIQKHAAQAQQPIPESPGELARCCFDSLAMCYAETIAMLEQATGQEIGSLYAVGGGVQNDLLNRLTATVIGRPLLTGPVEATAIGNVLVQAMGLGLVSDLVELRRIVARSFPPERVAPLDDPAARPQRRMPLPINNTEATLRP